MSVFFAVYMWTYSFTEEISAPIKQFLLKLEFFKIKLQFYFVQISYVSIKSILKIMFCVLLYELEMNSTKVKFDGLLVKKTIL